MGAKRLFRTTEEILNGYSELNVKSGRKVYLRGRALETGNVSLYLYSNDNGKVHRITLNEILVKEDSLSKKNQNEETLKRAGLRADKLNIDVTREIAGLPKIKRKNVFLADYIKALSEQAKEEGRKTRSYGLQSLYKHINKCNSKIKLSNANSDFVREFIRYVEKDAVDTHYKGGNSDKHLSENTCWTLCRNLKSVFTIALREKLINSNPFSELGRNDIPHVQLDRRGYLDVGEVKRLIDTECKSLTIKQTFLFCCFVGMRYSDVRSLTWKEIGNDDNGLYVKTIQQKTKDPVKAYIPKAAEQYLPKRNNSNDDRVFTLPNNTYCNKILKEWAKAAGVCKRVTFHMSRHTAATMLLNVDVPLEVVAKQLGHKRTSTTEIYAKIIGRTQSVAVNKLDNLF